MAGMGKTCDGAVEAIRELRVPRCNAKGSDPYHSPSSKLLLTEPAKRSCAAASTRGRSHLCGDGLLRRPRAGGDLRRDASSFVPVRWSGASHGFSTCGPADGLAAFGAPRTDHHGGSPISGAVPVSGGARNYLL